MGGRSPRVVVGVDGTEGSIEALRWGAHEAARRRCPLHVMTCVELPVSVEAGIVGSAHGVGSSMDDMVHQREVVNRRAVDLARSFGLGVEVSGETVLGAPGYAVASAASEDDIVVVGATSHPGRLTDVLGSVATVVAYRAHGPVVVVHGADRPSPDIDRIVVGIDGSECSDEALRWAVDEAARTSAELELVHAWSYPYPNGRHGASDPRHEMRVDAMRMLEAAECQARTRCQHVRVHSVVSEDNPAKAIIDAGRSADLVVVGSRGRGGFAALLLGSTSRAVLQHASVPVALVRHAA
ncbi:MAG: universal stress protein [Ilumatobacteraceae bacterium]